jgi:hypothetical protein
VQYYIVHSTDLLRQGREKAMRLAAMLLAAIAAPNSVSAQAQIYKMNERGQTGELTIARQQDGSLSVVVSFRRPGCLGDISAKGRQQGATIVAESTDRMRGMPVCTLRIDVQQGSMLVREQNCSMHHGASCAADGTYRLAR